MNTLVNQYSIRSPSYDQWVHAQWIGLESYFIYLDYLRAKPHSHTGNTRQYADCARAWPNLKEALNRTPNFFGLPPSVLHFLKLSLSSIPSSVLGEQPATLESLRTRVRDT